MNLKRISQRGMLLIAALMVSLSSMAFNFVGKTFKGSRSENGEKIAITIKFLANNKATALMSGTRLKTTNDTHCYWEESGDYINFCDSMGDCAILGIDWENDYGEVQNAPQLQMFDSNGTWIITLRYAPSSSSSSSKKKRK